MHWTRKIRIDARKETLAAVERGDLPPIVEGTKCVDCGEQAECYEHRNYFKPLDVEPTCIACNNRRGEGYPPVRGKSPNSHGLSYRWGGRKWASISKLKKRDESLEGADVRTRTSERDALDKAMSYGMPVMRRIAIFNDLHHSEIKYGPLKNGDLRAEYFKKHDPYYISEEVV